MTLGRCSLWTVSCGRTGGPRPSRSSLRRNFSRRLAADAYGTSGGTKEQMRGGVLPRGDCGPCPSELAARRLREEDARKDFIGKVPPVFASHTVGNSGRSRGRWKRGPRPAGGSGATSGGVVLQPLRPGEGTTAQRPATGAAQGISFLDILPRGINTPQYCRPHNREFSHVFIPRYPCEVLLPPHVPMIATSRVSI